MIGFDVKIPRIYLDLAVAKVPVNMPARISPKLSRIWAPEGRLVTQARQLYPILPASETLFLHWGLTCIAYPFFYQVSNVVGQQLKLYSDFDERTIIRRMIEKHGDRGTVHKAVRAVLATWLDWGVLTLEAKVYRATNPLATTNLDLEAWLLEAYLVSYYGQELALDRLLNAPGLFPFKLATNLYHLRKSRRFLLHRQGDDDIFAPAWGRHDANYRSSCIHGL